jgi:hypothetical protein
MTVEPARFILEGVPRVHFYEGGKRCPEDICFPSVVRAILEYLGDPDFGCKHAPTQNPHKRIYCTYSYVMGMSGLGSHFSWDPDWHSDNENLAPEFMPGEPGEAWRRGIAAVGYAAEMINKEPGRDNEAYFRERIIASLRDAKRPVIGFGVVGPPEPALITGYDEGGDALIGWSFFQGMPDFNAGAEIEPSGQFRKRDWYKDTTALMILGEKLPPPKIGDAVMEAMRWAVQIARTPMVHGRYCGLAAYDAWAEHILRDKEIPADDEALLRQRHAAHEGAIGAVAEARWYAAQWLIEALEKLHHKRHEEMLHAAACYAQEHALMWQIWNLAGGIGNPEAYQKFANPALRRQMAAIILQARDKDAEAIRHIENALNK